MGLVSISSFQPLVLDDLPTEIATYYVIAYITEDEVVKLFYSSQDPHDKLKDLLMENGVEEAGALAILKAAGKANPARDNLSSLAEQLPGVSTLRVKHPVTGIESSLMTIVINLNDFHMWTREAIADWIENTCDTKDIMFKTPEGVNDEKNGLSKITRVVTIKRVL